MFPLVFGKRHRTGLSDHAEWNVECRAVQYASQPLHGRNQPVITRGAEPASAPGEMASGAEGLTDVVPAFAGE